MTIHTQTKIRFSWGLLPFIITLIALFLIGAVFFYQKVNASVLSVTHTPSSGVKSVANNHTVSFTTVNAVPANGFIIVLFSDGFTFQSGIDYTDVDFIVDGSQRALSASNSSVSDGATFGSYKMQINLNNITGVSAGAQVEIRIGTHATEGSVGDKQVVNPGTAGNGSINVDTNTPISAGMSLVDSGGASMTITNPPGVNIAEAGGSTAVSEAGVWDTYYVSLNSPPSSNVTVAITPNAQLTTNKSSLTFTSSNWSSQQSVWVFAVDDSAVEGSHTGTVSHTVSSSDTNYNGLSVNSVTATITDNDIAGVVVTQSSGSTVATEGGATDTYTLALNMVPSANVTVTIAAGTQLSVAPSSTVTFTSANWSTPQTITVSAVDDFVAEGVHTGTITHTSSSSDVNFNNISVSNITANITDNDTAGVSVAQTESATAVTEAGGTDTYTLVLSSQPSADVTVTIVPGTQLSVAPSLTTTFTSVNWNTPQIVTVSAVNDSIAEGAHTGTVSHTTSSTDANFQNLTVASVTANITDNDTVGVTIVQTDSATAATEGGATDTYTVVLTSQPSANVTITPSGGTQLSVAPASLTFTSANWNTPQTVTVTAVDDTTVESSHTGTVAHAKSSADTSYNAVNIADVSVAISDNDHAAAPEPAPASGGGGGGGGGGGIVATGAGVTVQPTTTEPSVTTPASPDIIAEKSSKPFSDLENGHWAEDAVIKMYNKKILLGKKDGIFDGTANVTRAEMAAIVLRSLELKCESAAPIVFKDVDEKQWYAPCVATAFEKGILKMDKQKKVRPNDSATRAEIVTMFFRAFQLGIDENIPLDEKELKKVSFSDFENEVWWSRVVFEAFRRKILHGFSDGTIRPDNNATRFEIAVITTRFLDSLSEN